MKRTGLGGGVETVTEPQILDDAFSRVSTPEKGQLVVLFGQGRVRHSACLVCALICEVCV